MELCTYDNNNDDRTKPRCDHAPSASPTPRNSNLDILDVHRVPKKFTSCATQTPTNAMSNASLCYLASHTIHPMPHSLTHPLTHSPPPNQPKIPRQPRDHDPSRTPRHLVSKQRNTLLRLPVGPCPRARACASTTPIQLRPLLGVVVVVVVVVVTAVVPRVRDERVRVCACLLVGHW